jgi:hypothetical protein
MSRVSLLAIAPGDPVIPQSFVSGTRLDPVTTNERNTMNPRSDLSKRWD